MARAIMAEVLFRADAPEEYTIIERSSISVLIADVNGGITRGWQPLGGIGVKSSVDSIPTYIQAMIRYAPSEKAGDAEEALQDAANTIT